MTFFKGGFGRFAVSSAVVARPTPRNGLSPLGIPDPPNFLLVDIDLDSTPEPQASLLMALPRLDDPKEDDIAPSPFPVVRSPFSGSPFLLVTTDPFAYRYHPCAFPPASLIGFMVDHEADEAVHLLLERVDLGVDIQHQNDGLRRHEPKEQSRHRVEELRVCHRKTLIALPQS